MLKLCPSSINWVYILTPFAHFLPSCPTKDLKTVYRRDSLKLTKPFGAILCQPSPICEWEICQAKHQPSCLMLGGACQPVPFAEASDATAILTPSFCPHLELSLVTGLALVDHSVDRSSDPTCAHML